jgi:hypothetical protein
MIYQNKKKRFYMKKFSHIKVYEQDEILCHNIAMLTAQISPVGGGTN